MVGYILVNLILILVVMVKQNSIKDLFENLNIYRYVRTLWKIKRHFIIQDY
jgi:hypothetical protein